MGKLKVLMNELEKGIEQSLTQTISAESYKGKEANIVKVISEFQAELLSQLFGMQVVESQIEASSLDIMNTIDMQKETSDAMVMNSEALMKVNEDSKLKVTESMETAEKISSSTMRLKNSSEALTETTNDARRVVDQQVVEVYKIIEMVDGVSKTSQHTNSSIDELGEGINKISEILQAVQNFYKQTKLLALNASIESARAGEAGKGFSVVAKEMENLAEGSSKSVDEIVEIMKSIDTYIEKVKENSANETSEIKAAVEKAESVTKGLSSITQSFTDIQHKLENMNTDLEGNSLLTAEINTVLSETELAFLGVSEEIDGINTHITHQSKHTQKIMDIEGILQDISSSLNIITKKYEVNLLDKAKATIGDTCDEMVGLLEAATTSALVEEVVTGDENSVNKEALDKFIGENKQIEAIWTNTDSGAFVYSNPPAGISNASIRNWFNEAMKGQAFISEIYISGISKSPCLTLSIPLEQAGVVVGVLGVDITIK